MALFSRFAITCLLINCGCWCFGGIVADSTKSSHLSNWAFQVLNTPKLELTGKDEIIIAVIDDGFHLSHNSLSGFVFTNNAEIPGNMVDDDRNGYIDDYMGWDVSDNDGDVQVSKSMETQYYHGTFVSSLITRILSDCFGEQANKTMKILPVKVLSDHAKTTAILDGYRGIKYAMEMGADIVCCAWSGGIPSDAEKTIINKALLEQILIIGSAGNTNQEQVDFPASMAGIYAIAALDTLLRKNSDSNYGMPIDLALPGENVRAGHPLASNAWFYGRGTSAAAGLAAGCAAVLKGINPKASPHEIIEALKNTATPIDSLNYSYCGKLGAGIPNLSKAVKYLSTPSLKYSFFNPSRPEGTIYMDTKNKRTTWSITPWGAYQSISIVPEVVKDKDLRKNLHLFTRDSLYFKGMLDELRGGITLPGSEVRISFISSKRKEQPTDLRINYQVQTIDSASLYCRDIAYIEAEDGLITDGSGDDRYANKSACSWHIHAPESERIWLNFTEFDTEAKVDFVWLFDGYLTNPDHLIAKFSGPEIPPSITSRTNKVKVWFVTDSKRTGGGWELHFKGVHE